METEVARMARNDQAAADAAQNAETPTSASEESQDAGNQPAVARNHDDNLTQLEEKVGSRSVTDDERAEHLAEIEEAERVVSSRENEWEGLKLECKAAKDSFDAAVN